MTPRLVHSQKGLVDVFWRDDLDAVYLKWHSEYDEGDGVRRAVREAVKFVKETSARNWLVDISTSQRALSEKDLDWVNGTEFLNLIRASSLRRFVMIPPHPDTGQDVDWISEWEKNTLKNLGDRVTAKVLSDMVAIAEFLSDKPTGAKT